MIKELIILAIAVLALSQAVPVEKSQPKLAPEAVLLENANDELEGGDDLVPAASAWRGYGGWGGRRYGGGWGGGWGGGYGRGFGGYGHGGGFGGGWGGRGGYWG